MKKFLTCGLAVFVALSCALSAADQVQKIRVSKGANFGYSVNSQTTNTVTMMGQENVSNLKATMKSVVSVKETTKDSTTFGIDLKDAVLSVSGMSMFMVPDTTIRRDDLSGAKEMIVTNASGKVLRRDAPVPVPSADKDQMIIRQVANRNLMRGLFVAYPEQALTTGLEWTSSQTDTTDQGNGKLISSVAMRYTFLGNVDTLGMKCGRIRAKSEKFIINGSMKQMGHEVTIEGDGVVNASYLFELQTGMPVFMQSTSQSDQRIVVGEGMEIPSSLEVKTTIVRVAK